ncbi:MAG: glyoxalase [Gammaproteobacteria bacterium]|nr:glyoxalase [Gammaproteobacteria bacterium]
MKNPFHLAIPVDNLNLAIDFYEKVLGCQIGRSGESWIDFNLFGHQLVCHLVEKNPQENSNLVDGDDVPIPHFGVILNYDQFDELKRNLKNNNQTFLIRPRVRFKGQTGEQMIMFLKDPSGNAIEFKAFKSKESLFKV